MYINKIKQFSLQEKFTLKESIFKVNVLYINLGSDHNQGKYEIIIIFKNIAKLAIDF